MSYITTLTNAQLQTARDSAIRVQQALHKFAQGTVTETTAYSEFSVELNTLLNNLVTTLDGTIVNDGDTLTGVTPTGTFNTTVTFTVTSGAITGIALS